MAGLLWHGRLALAWQACMVRSRPMAAVREQAWENHQADPSSLAVGVRVESHGALREPGPAPTAQALSREVVGAVGTKSPHRLALIRSPPFAPSWSTSHGWVLQAPTSNTTRVKDLQADGRLALAWQACFGMAGLLWHGRLAWCVHDLWRQYGSRHGRITRPIPPPWLLVFE